MWHFEDNLLAKDIITRHTSKLGRGLFILQPPINFHFAIKPLINMAKKWWSEGECAWLSKGASKFNWFNWLDQNLTSCHVKLTLVRNVFQSQEKIRSLQLSLRGPRKKLYLWNTKCAKDGIAGGETVAREGSSGFCFVINWLTIAED